MSKDKLAMVYYDLPFGVSKVPCYGKNFIPNSKHRYRVAEKVTPAYWIDYGPLFSSLESAKGYIALVKEGKV